MWKCYAGIHCSASTLLASCPGCWPPTRLPKAQNALGVRTMRGTLTRYHFASSVLGITDWRLNTEKFQSATGENDSPPTLPPGLAFCVGNHDKPSYRSRQTETVLTNY